MEAEAMPPTPNPNVNHVLYLHPTVAPHVVIVPILVCIIAFPILVLLLICALRERAKRARRNEARDKRRGITTTELGYQNHQREPPDGKPIRIVKNGKRKTIVRFKPMPELDLDTVVEERSEFDAEVSISDLIPSSERIHLNQIENGPCQKSYRFGNGTGRQPISKPLHFSHYDSSISRSTPSPTSPTTVNSQSVSVSPTSPCQTTFNKSCQSSDLDKVDEEQEISEEKHESSDSTINLNTTLPQSDFTSETKNTFVQTIQCTSPTLSLVNKSIETEITLENFPGVGLCQDCKKKRIESECSSPEKEIMIDYTLDESIKKDVEEQEYIVDKSIVKNDETKLQSPTKISLETITENVTSVNEIQVSYQSPSKTYETFLSNTKLGNEKRKFFFCEELVEHI